MNANVVEQEKQSFALVFWIDDQQYSVVEGKDLIGAPQLNEIAPVAWRIKKKGVVSTNWHEAKIISYSDNEESLQLLCDTYAEKRAFDVNNVDGKKRKRTKTAKGKELSLASPGKENESPEKEIKAKSDGGTRAKKSKIVENKKCKNNAHDKEPKLPSLKSQQLESAKLMAREVIQATFLNDSDGSDMDEDISIQSLPHSVSPTPTTTTRYPRSSPEIKSHVARHVNGNLNEETKTFIELSPTPSNAYSTPSPTLKPLQEQNQRNFTNANNSTPITPISYHLDMCSTESPSPLVLPSCKNSATANLVAPRQLFQSPISNDDKQPSRTFEKNLSSEINDAICLSYNCDNWQKYECEEKENNAPKCQCAELREENKRLKEAISNLRKVKKNSSGFPKAPMAAITYLETLTKHLKVNCRQDAEEITVTWSNDADPSTEMPLPVSIAKSVETSTATISNSNIVASTQPSQSHFKKGDGKQELCPGSGVFIPPLQLRQIHHKAGADLKILFHLLMDYFFKEDTLAKSVAFGNRVLPIGKEVLDPSIVSAIKGYMLVAAKIFNVPALDSSKINKMFTNKCTSAQARMKRKLMAMK